MAVTNATSVASMATTLNFFTCSLRAIQHIGVTVPDLDAATQFFKDGLGAKVAYDGLTKDDEPRQGTDVERQLGLPSGAAIHKQRFLVIGAGPG